MKNKEDELQPKPNRRSKQKQRKGGKRNPNNPDHGFCRKPNRRTDLGSAYGNGERRGMDKGEEKKKEIKEEEDERKNPASQSIVG
ncbi:hypothetical protein SLA2020_353530 [Shorea laevis]